MTLLEVMVVAGLLGMLAAIAIVTVSRPRERAQLVTCLANLRQLENVKQQWAVEHQKEGGDTPAMAELQPYFRYAIGCPVNGTYTINSLTNKATCSVAGHTLE
jgi:type II secretory pathway pseudopilin PulG